MQLSKYLVLFIFVFTAVAPGVFADESSKVKKESACDLKEPLAQLSLLKKESEGTAPETELALRKDILATTMGCTSGEAERLIGSLEELEPSSKQAASLRKVYIAGLEEIMKLATVRQESAAELETIGATQKAARSAKNWRDNSYRPLAWEAAQLVVLEKNQDLLSSASDRLKQLRLYAGSLVNLGGNAAIQEKLDKAEKLRDNAQSATDEVYALLNQTPRSEHEPIAEKISYSLDTLSETYDLFLEAHKGMQKFFPLDES